MYSRKWIKMKSGEREAYLALETPKAAATMVPVTVAFLCLCSSLLHVSSLLCSLFFSRCPASSASFLHPPLVAFLWGLLCFFEKKQGNESLLWFLSVPLPSFSSVSLRLLRSLFSTVRGSFFVSPVFFLVPWSPVSGFFALSLSLYCVLFRSLCLHSRDESKAGNAGFLLFPFLSLCFRSSVSWVLFSVFWLFFFGFSSPFQSNSSPLLAATPSPFIRPKSVVTAGLLNAL